MHPNYHKADSLSYQVIGAAMEVHRDEGPGLIESIYERCLMRELELRGHRAVNQIQVPIEYKGLTFEETLRLDVYVEDCLIMENKVVEKILPVHCAQLLSYMRLLNAPVGLIFNYRQTVLKDDMVRLVLKGADQP
jgi:GxxExxY protein